MEIQEDQTFEKIDYTLTPFIVGEYEKCTFTQCNLANAVLSNTTFSDCTFIGCNMSLVKMIGTALRNVHFQDCKLL